MITYDIAVYTVLFAITAFIISYFFYMCKVDRLEKKIEAITKALEDEGIYIQEGNK